jgi:hypothetical protein
MAPIYKRVQYQKLNGFDVPYWDIKTYFNPCSIYDLFCFYATNGLSFINGTYYETSLKGIIDLTPITPSNWTGTITCGSNYAIYTGITASLSTGVWSFNSSGDFQFFELLSGTLDCGETINTKYDLVAYPSPSTITCKNVIYADEADLEGYITYNKVCDSPTPSITPTISNTPSITPSITSTPPPSKSPTPTATPTITNTPSITPTITPTTSPKASATPTATPTPSPTDPCYCKYYSIDNNDKGQTLSVEYVDCDTLNTEILIVPIDTITTQCSCSTPIRVFGSTDYTITLLGACPT